MNREMLQEDLVRDEGEVLHAYQDSEGFWTIGVGILIDARRGGGITREESRYLLGNRIARAEADLDRALPWWREMTERRQRALANMCFNMGIGNTKKGLLSFKVTLGHLQAGRYEDAAREMLDSTWAKQVGERAERLAEMIRVG